MSRISLFFIASLFTLFGCTDEPLSKLGDASPVLQAVNESQSESPNHEFVTAFPQLSFSRPIFLTHAGDGSNLLYVVEQAGKIHSFENRDDVEEKTLFVDLTEIVNSSANERGLLGLAFAPDYKESRYFYVNYTALGDGRTIVSRFQVEEDGSIDLKKELVLLEEAQPYSNHNGGMIAFGADKNLYIAFGDGGAGGDPENHGQKTSTLLGTIARITPTEDGYTVPEDNPFFGNPEEGKKEIFAWGLRNPWRFSFDSKTNKLWAADVGQGAFEEINIIERDKNYGWVKCEGFHEFRRNNIGPFRDCPAEFEPPIHVYDRDAGRSVTGGYVYRGSEHPSLEGSYIYADYVTRTVWKLKMDEEGNVSNEVMTRLEQRPSSFGEDANGEVYAVGHQSSGAKIYRLKEVDSE